MHNFFIILFFPVLCLANAPVHDVISSGHLMSLLEKAEEKIDYLRDLKGRLDNVSLSLSCPTRISDQSALDKINFIFKRRLYNLDQKNKFLTKNDIKSFFDHLNYIESNYIFPKRAISRNDLNKISNNNKKLLNKTTKSALAVSNTNKVESKDYELILKNISKEIKKTEHMHQDIRIMNQQLLIMNQQLSNLREIQNKSLELFSVITLNFNNNLFNRKN